MNSERDDATRHEARRAGEAQASSDTEGARPVSVSIEEAVFGANWQQVSCTVSQAKAYFKARFGLGHTAFYEILRPRLRLRALMPSHLGQCRSVGLMLFADEVVSACDRLEEAARRDTRTYYR